MRLSAILKAELPKKPNLTQKCSVLAASNPNASVLAAQAWKFEPGREQAAEAPPESTSVPVLANTRLTPLFVPTWARQFENQVQQSFDDDSDAYSSLVFASSIEDEVGLEAWIL